MSRFLFVVLFLNTVWACAAAFAQTVSDFYATDEMVWFGVDYSNVRCIGSDGFSRPDQIVNYYFAEWNRVILSEQDKYNLSRYFLKRSVINELGAVQKLHSKVSLGLLIQDEPYFIPKSSLENIVASYDLSHSEVKDGFGLVFIMETMNKNSESASAWVVIFDIASRKVLISEKMTEKAGGFGFRNYWLSPIYRMMKECEGKHKAWKKL